MCGRLTLRNAARDIAHAFEVFAYDQLPGAEWPPRYNVSPSQDVFIVRRDQAGHRELAAVRWGLVPPWAKDLKIGFSLINARSDTVATKPAFRSAYKRSRCLVPVDGYYEWLTKGKSAKIPHLYEVNGGKPFALAGLWERNDGLGGIESCTIITTDANEIASLVHNRMPVILEPGDYNTWLNSADTDVGHLLVPYSGEGFSVRRLGTTFVNNARNEGPECVNSA